MLIRIDRDPSRSQLLVFSLCWLLFFGGLSLWAITRGATGLGVGVLGGGSLLAPLLLLVFPRAVRWLYVGLSYATWSIGFVVSFLVLCVLYFGVITPMGLAMRMTSYDPMNRRWDRQRGTYWDRREQAEGPRRYLRQF